jgi:hypothetical protein
MLALPKASERLPFGCHSVRICGGLPGSRTPRTPLNASQCRIALTSQGRNAFSIRFAPHAQHPGSMGTSTKRWWLQRDSSAFVSFDSAALSPMRQSV